MQQNVLCGRLKVYYTYIFPHTIQPLYTSPYDGGWKQWLAMTDHLRLQQRHGGGSLCLSILNLAHTNETLTELQELASFSVFSPFICNRHCWCYNGLASCLGMMKELCHTDKVSLCSLPLSLFYVTYLMHVYFYTFIWIINWWHLTTHLLATVIKGLADVHISPESLPVFKWTWSTQVGHDVSPWRIKLFWYIWICPITQQP